MTKYSLLLKYSISLLIAFSIINAHYSFALDIYTGSDFVSRPYENKSISMDFKGARLSDVLKIFSQQSGLNFIASTKVSDKTINLYFEKVPVEEALERILSANNLTYELKPGSNIFIVKENPEQGVELMTRVYKLKYATVPSSKINSTFSDDSNSGSSQESATSTVGIIESIKKLLSEDGSVVEDPRTNSIIVTDIPSKFSAIEKSIARLDVKVPQILIEVEMLDISKNTSELLGAKFGSSPLSFSGGSKDSLFPFNKDNAVDDGFSFNDAQYSVSKLSFSGLTFVLNFLKTQSDTKSLARPRILTLNNETAKIHIKTDEAIGIAATNTTSAENNSTTVSQAERVETGVFLTVTPQANTDSGDILLAVQPKVIQATTGSTYAGQTFKDPEERGTMSMLRVKDGETVVIGGLLKTNLQDTRTKVPVLAKIPFFGAAFRHKDKEEEQRELIIFITPNIINEKDEQDFYASENFLREQDIPFSKNISPAVNTSMSSEKSMSFNTNRLKLIDKELTDAENQGF